MSEVIGETKKLYQLERGAMFRIVDKGFTLPNPIKLLRIDGMYSLCEYEGETLHIFAGAPVEEVFA